MALTDKTKKGPKGSSMSGAQEIASFYVEDLFVGQAASYTRTVTEIGRAHV